MKKIVSLILIILVFISGCNQEKTTKEDVKISEFETYYLYGEFEAEKVTLLLNGCLLFFDLDDYGISEILAGDVVKVSHHGDMIVMESYPGQVSTNSIEIVEITSEKAPVISLVVLEDKSIVSLDKMKHNIKNECVYAINEDMSFTLLSELSVDTKLYATYKETNDLAELIAIYTYNPRK